MSKRSLFNFIVVCTNVGFFVVYSIELHYMVRCLCASLKRCTQKEKQPTTHHHYQMMHWDTVCGDVKGHITKCSCHMMMHGHCLMICCMTNNSAETSENILSLIQIFTFLHSSLCFICFFLLVNITQCT